MAFIAETTPFDDVQIAGTPVPVIHTVSPGTTILVVAFFDRTGIGFTSLALDYNSIPLTNVSGFSGEEPQFWYLLNPPAGAGVLSINDPTYQKIVEGAVYNIHGGIDTVTPFGSLLHVDGTGTEYTLSLNVPSFVGDLVLDCTGVSETGFPVNPMNPGVGQTEKFDQINAAQVVHRAAGSFKVATGTLTPMAYTINNSPASVNFHYAAVALHVVPSPEAPPTSLGSPAAYARKNYCVVKWDRPLRDSQGVPLADVDSYELYRASFMNESDLTLIATITTLDAAGKIDTAYVDTNPPENPVYRVIAVVNMIQSELSNRAVATFSPTQIDDKTELIDQKILFWDESNWDDSLWT